METKTIGTWLRHTIDGLKGSVQRGKGATGPQVGMQVTTLDGKVLGTISTVWLGKDAADHAAHEDTLGVLPSGNDGKGMIFVPSTSVGHQTEHEVSLTVDLAQVSARGWLYRPSWLPKDAPIGPGPTGAV